MHRCRPGLLRRVTSSSGPFSECGIQIGTRFVHSYSCSRKSGFAHSVCSGRPTSGSHASGRHVHDHICSTQTGRIVATQNFSISASASASSSSTATFIPGEIRPPPPESLPFTINQILRLPLPSASSSSLSTSSSTSTSSTPLNETEKEVRTETTNECGIRVQLNGWVKSVRKQKRVAFAVITDGSCERSVQAVFTGERLEWAKALTNGCCVRLSGVLKESIGPGQDREVLVDRLEYLGGCEPEEYPIAKKSLTVEYLRDYAHLRARTSHIAAMLRLRDQTQRVLNKFFEQEEFTYVHTPLITANDCEGAGNTFSVVPSPSPSPSPAPPPSQPSSPSPASPQSESSENEKKHFFGRPAYLTVSSQLHLEALASSLSRVYTISPCFRAERSQTGRHLAEFWMLEAEWAFVDSVSEVCDVVERAVKSVLNLEGAGKETLGVLRGYAGLAKSAESKENREGEEKLRVLEEAARWDKGWERMSYSTAVRELRKFQERTSAREKFRFEPVWGASLQSEHERWLAEKLVGGPVFVTDYPAALKPFYMRANSSSTSTSTSDPYVEGETVACFDLLVPHLGELVGGSIREERLPELRASLKRHGLDEKEFGWYLDLRRYGSAPHGGFGLGLDRLVQWVSGVENIRECVPMPRYAGRMLVS